MKLYRLKNKEMPWGDYGDILLGGMSAHLYRHNGLIQYERTGPFQPEIVLSGVDDMLVTDSMKTKIEQSDLKGFQFQPVIKKHISNVEWTNWNLEKDDPEFYPENGEPEDYILGLPHSQELADKMEGVWEVIAEENGTFSDNGIYKPGDKEIDIMRIKDRGWFFVTEKAKKWIENNGDGWIVFRELNEPRH